MEDSIKEISSLDESPVREKSSPETKPKTKSELISISELEAEVENEINHHAPNYQIDLHELDSLHQVTSLRMQAFDLIIFLFDSFFFSTAKFTF